MGQTGGVPRLFVVSARCQGAVVRVSAPDTFRTYAVARAADGAVTALTLTTTSTARPGTLVIEAFQHGRLTGYFQTSV